MPEKRFSSTLECVRMSPIVTISEMVRERAPAFAERTGKDFVYFQRGEIDFATPDYISKAAKQAIDSGKTKYPKSGGEPAFKDAILRKLQDCNNIYGLSRENVVCTYGGQEALQLVFKLFEGEKGAGFAPCWSCVLENFVPYSKIDFTEVPLRDDFSVDFEQLEKVLKKVRFFYFNTPHNPTGKVFSEAETREIAERCHKNDVYLISDEAYENIVYDGKKHFSAVSMNLENIISTFTFSKSYAMTGWRLGYLVARNKRIVELVRLGDYSQTAGVVTFLQYAGKEALDNRLEGEKVIKDMVAEFQRRRNVLYEGLSKIDGLKVEKPEGAFYMFPNFTELMPEGLQGKEREMYIFDLLMKHGVATVYGSCFGKHFGDNVRISFSTTSIPMIEEGLGRFRNALGAAKPSHTYV